ncbi:hypothetical protein ACP275_14G138500 [Erythranthe tilingii]
MDSTNNKTSTPSPLAKDRHSDMELMKEKFAKLLLREDMSGGGKGVSSALALSNAITNLADLLLVAAILMEFAAQSSRGINNDIPEHSEKLSPIKN